MDNEVKVERAIYHQRSMSLGVKNFHTGYYGLLTSLKSVNKLNKIWKDFFLNVNVHPNITHHEHPFID